MKIEMTIFRTMPKHMEFMRHVDLCPNGKFFVEIIDVLVMTKSEINDSYFNKLIKKSYDSINGDIESKPFVVAIEFSGNIYAHPSAKIISDGVHEIFIPENWREANLPGP